ncbi:MAG: carboxymuconolactone decarboxylase family protein [Alphaproteobacteria bacterium]|nr:carboxymuconolactone decarboxylase family protein [Alphaproteobacteria bacterium]
MSQSQLRLPYFDLSGDSFKHLLGMNQSLGESTLGVEMLELVYLRVSQINGCSYCLALHSKALREREVAQVKLDTIAGWRLSPHFSEKERAALAWAESVTDISRTHAPDDVYLPLKEHFKDAEISDLTLAVALMNAFNRIAVSMKR